MMFVLGTSLFIALWLGVALGVVLCEPMLRQKSMREARRRYRAQIAALRAQLAVYQAAGEFRAEAAYATAMLPVIEAEAVNESL